LRIILPALNISSGQNNPAALAAAKKIGGYYLKIGIYVPTKQSFGGWVCAA
jgi:argonaute-like protein implicated in RNA metabolism and viral defense